ncbi:MAG: hypothetical protein H6673_05340 [Anaerolineales bacterium]|nr:hypothetical protein [Anaerolineales bacterium]
MQPINLIWQAEDETRLLTHFIMPPNDQCSTWWLEVEAPVEAEVWVNGQALGLLDALTTIVDITHAVAIGENTIHLRLSDGMATLAGASVVPYPCA